MLLFWSGMSSIITLSDTGRLIGDPILDSISAMFTKDYDLPVPTRYQQLTDGLINQTYSVDDCWIVQRVNPIFGHQVNDDIAALTSQLKTQNVPVPQILRTKTGKFWVNGSDYGLSDGIWRVMTKLPGKTHHFVQSIEQIQHLTLMMSRFHKALNGFNYTFKHTRPGVHDFQRHYRALDEAIQTHSKHRLYAQVEALYQKIQHLMKFVDDTKVMDCEDLRIIHGDPKISNFLFEQDEIVGVVDLDTMAKSRVAFDIGDAIRSWCNPCPEDVTPDYHPEYAREAMGLYLENSDFLTRAERQSLPFSAPFITLELSARFARDALCEDYFGFNPNIGHGEHSLIRAQSMAQLCDQMLS